METWLMVLVAIDDERSSYLCVYQCLAASLEHARGRGYEQLHQLYPSQPDFQFAYRVDDVKQAPLLDTERNSNLKWLMVLEAIPNERADYAYAYQCCADSAERAIQKGHQELERLHPPDSPGSPFSFRVLDVKRSAFQDED